MNWGSCCECPGVWKGSDGLSVIHPISRQNEKARGVSFKKTLIYRSHWARVGTRLGAQERFRESQALIGKEQDLRLGVGI